MMKRNLRVPESGGGSKNRNGLLKNATAMVCIQFANYLFPLILVPFFARQLGVLEYGRIALCLAVIQMAGVIVDYGFGLSASYRVSRWSNKRAYIEKLLASVYFHKILFALLVSAAIFLWAVLQKDPRLETLLPLSLISIVGQSLLPVWLFQGLEKMPALTAATLGARFLYLLPCLFFVNGPEDSYLVLISLGVSHCVAGGFGIFLWWTSGYRLRLPNRKFAWAVLIDSTPFFASRAALLSYTSFGAIFLGLTAGPLQVSIYSAAEQLYRGAIGLVGMASQALYPYMARTRDFVVFGRILKGAICLAGVAAVVGLSFGGPIVVFVFGQDFEASSLIISVFAVTFSIACPSILLGYPFLGAVGRVQLANRSVYFAGATQLMVLTALLVSGHATAFLVAVSVTVAELVVLIFRAKWAGQYYPKVYFLSGEACEGR